MVNTNKSQTLPAVEAVELSEQLPFTLKQIKDAIPPHCFEPSVPRSLAYFFLDIGIIAGLYAIAAYLDSWYFFPIFWLMQGTMFWALFVVGHDCGHRSFSRYEWLNDLIGHLSHTPILVPFHGWRISHRTHHNNTGSLENDESWYPISESRYEKMTGLERFARFDIPLLMYPVYLFKRSPGKQGTHFDPSSPLFKPSEKNQVLTSTICCIAMIVLLGVLTYQWGILWFVKYYFMPYLIFVMWLDLVTFLHHTEEDIPWYRGENWNFLKGALSTIDRDYGFINEIHHNIGTHVAHHIFLNMPHYHLKEATEAIKPLLGDYYRKSDRPIWQSFWRSYRNCHIVSDTGATVYYRKTR
ncbi:fatty acid desaturase [Oscillatoria sp. FACHB-1406]|nr:fatty acid desaturase [Oscillatoria sp. FACHB-1406]